MFLDPSRQELQLELAWRNKKEIKEELEVGEQKARGNGAIALCVSQRRASPYCV